MKIGPSIMAERLCKEPKNIGIYTIPSFTEIQSYVLHLFSGATREEE
jgi:hypothetical protein